jgi:hypothetical protein
MDMALIDINWKPDRNELRTFGEISLAMLTVIALVFYWLDRLTAVTSLYLCAAGLVIFIASRISTKLVKPFYLLLYAIALPIGLVLTHILMAMFYFILLTPICLIFRLIGRDPLKRKWDPNAKTYWIPHRAPDSLKRYFNQF